MSLNKESVLQVLIITVRNEVAKVMFSQVCVCPPGGCLVLGGAWSRGVPGPGGLLWEGDVCSGGSLVQGRGVCIPSCTEADTPQQMTTAADGTHPTGMHSCLDRLLRDLWFQPEF